MIVIVLILVRSIIMVLQIIIILIMKILKEFILVTILKIWL